MEKTLPHLNSCIRRLPGIQLFITLLLLLGSTLSYAQTFTGTYPFTSVASGAGGTTDPTSVPTATGVTFGSFSAVGTPANPNAGSRFSFTGWPLDPSVTTGITTGSLTGLPSSAIYYKVTITPATGFSISLSSITFTVQRSATGPRQYYVRSSADPNTNLTATVNPASTAISVPTTTGTTNVFLTDDATANTGTALNGSTITLSGSNYTNITSAVTFYFYAYNAEAAGGSFSVDNVIFNGSATATSTTPPADNTPPTTAAGYPKTGNITTTAVDFTNNINEAGTTYYEVLPSAATAPSAAQVKSGQNAAGTAVTLSGSFAVTAGTDALKTITGLTAGTAYTIYAVSQDVTGNLQTTVSANAFNTLAPAFANTSTAYPKTSNLTGTSVDIISNLNAAGTTYYVTLPASNTSTPSAAQIIAGQDGTGAAAFKAGSFAVGTAGTDVTSTITGLIASTAYNVYLVSQNTAATQQTAVTQRSITTPFAIYPFTNVVAPATSPTVVVGTGTTDPTPVPTATGILFGSFMAHNANALQPNAGGRFSFTNWPLDASSPVGGLTGVIDTTKYYQVTITPQNNKLNLTAINFTVQRSATGIRQYFVRSSLDNFATNLQASVDPTAAAALSVVSGNIFQITDAATTATPGNIITLDNTFTNLTHAVTFKFYGFNAEGTGGTFSIDDVAFAGSVGGAIAPADVTPPVNAAGYPKASNITNTGVDLVSNLNEAGTTYYVVTPANATAPTIAQIMAGKDGSGNTALKAGNISVTAANTDASATIGGLTLATVYNIYTVSQDAAATPNVQTALVSLPVTTTGSTPKTDQHITLAATATATYGSADIDPGATSDNATLPITYASGDVNVATIIANKVHILKAGTVTITASQAGDATHDPATAQQQILTIQPKAITVTAAAATKTYGDADPAFTYTTNTALLGTDAFTGALTRTAGEAVNSYAITQGTLALNSNYAITYVSANLMVTPKAITVTADAKTKTYGDADPALTYRTSTALIGTDAFTGSLTRAAGEAAGTYAITRGTLALNSNYALTYTGASLTITPKALTVTADNQSKIYGAANPAFTITYTGFANGDNSASLTTAATATSAATTASVPGTYDIIPAGATGANYTFNYVNGRLTVVSNSRTLSFTSLPVKTYGDADFDANATLSSGETPVYTTSDANIATVVNGKIHIVSAGSVTITASAPVNANYGTTQPVSQQLIINKANQTITFASIPDQLSGATYSLAAVTSNSGIPVTFTVTDPFIANVQGTSLNALTIGTTTVIASAAGNANYTAASTSQTVRVNDANADELVVHQAVSPNGDGINDFLFIEGIQDHPVNTVTIVNGTGVKIYEVNNYSNTNSNIVFNGRSNINGKQQLAGTYFYLIQLNDGGKIHRKTGYFLLKY